MKKIISIAVYGTHPTYVQGAIENLRIQPDVYPGWTCRFYIDDTVPKDAVKLLEKDAEVVIMPRSDGNYGMWWRFEPLKDTTIERFVVRDSDARLSVRDYEAVKEWEESGKEFHIMRDHECHIQKIMGGMWGATSSFINKIKDDYDKNVEEYFKTIPFNEMWYDPERKKYFNADQAFLKKYIWPRIINSHMAHVKAGHPTLKLLGNERVFPVENSNGRCVGHSCLL